MTKTAEELKIEGFTAGAAVGYFKNPTVTNGMMGGTWVPGTLVGLVQGRSHGGSALCAEIRLGDGSTVTVAMEVVRRST